MNYQEQQEQRVSTNFSDLVETTLGGKYKLLTLLGKGGMSSVYKAQHLLLNKVFAIKLMHAKHIADSNAVLRFRQEAAAAMSLSHPNIITVWDFDIEGEQPYQVIDYLEGRSLYDEIQKLQRLPLQRSLHIFTQVCAALAHAHSKGIIHRDLKPSNIMIVSENGDPDFVKIVDFGIAKVLPQEGEAIHRLTQTGEVFGSPFYMSPEQCMGRALDARADIYSMGCLMYETITGTPPFVGNAVFETVQMHMDAMPDSVRPFVPNSATAERLDYIICKAMAKQPADRYQSMDELRNDLMQLEAGEKQGAFTRFNQWFDLLRIKSQQVLKNKPIKLIAGLVAVAVMLSCVTGGLVFRLTNIRIPKPAAIASPLFAPEFEPNSGDETDEQLAVGLTQIKQQIELSQEDHEGVARTLRDSARIHAKSASYEAAAFDAAKLRAHLEELPPEKRSLLNEKSKDKANAMITFATIGDGCYFARPTPVNKANAEFFYDLAAQQMQDAAPRIFRRMHMKRADLQLRGDGGDLGYENALRAEEFLKRASGADHGFPHNQFQQGYRDEAGIYDRAVYYWKIGEATQRLAQYNQAQAAYEAAANEWGKLKEYNYEALCHYLAANVQRADIEHGNTSQNVERQSELNYLAALRYFEHQTAPDHVRTSDLHDRLSKIYLARKDYFRWAEHAVKARLEAAHV